MLNLTETLEANFENWYSILKTVTLFQHSDEPQSVTFCKNHHQKLFLILKNLTSSFYDKIIGFIDNSLLQSRTKRSTLSWVSDALDINGKRRTWHRHIIIQDVNRVLTLLKGCITNSVSSISLRSNDLFGYPTAWIVDGAGNFLLSSGPAYGPRIDSKFCGLKHVETCKKILLSISKYTRNLLHQNNVNVNIYIVWTRAEMRISPNTWNLLDSIKELDIKNGLFDKPISKIEQKVVGCGKWFDKKCYPSTF